MSFRAAVSPVLSLVRCDAVAGVDHSRLDREVTELFDRFRIPLLRYLSSFGIDRADAEEIIQEVFLALFRHLEHGKSRQNLPGWIFRVAHNLALRQRNQVRKDHDAKVPSGIENIAADASLNPEEQFAHNQTQQHLRAVLQALPELDRQCIFLRSEGLRYREIAGILDMSLGAVALSLARSLARMARCAERYRT